MEKSLRILTIESGDDERVLRGGSKELSKDDILEPSFQSFLDDLLYTAKNSKAQVGFDSGGIAAVQVGKSVRAFYILNYDTDEFELFINPKVDVLKTTQLVAKEGCLSVPSREGNVARFDKIRVTSLDREGKLQRKNYSGWTSRGIQHENDHLDGILFIDKLVD